jgi:hypothetical protein
MPAVWIATLEEAQGASAGIMRHSLWEILNETGLFFSLSWDIGLGLLAKSDQAAGTRYFAG